MATEDRCCQLFLWREDVKEANALNYREEYLRALNSIVDHQNVDEFVDSFLTLIEVSQQVRDIHKSATFELRNFSSNSFEVIAALRGTVEKSVKFF